MGLFPYAISPEQGNGNKGSYHNIQFLEYQHVPDINVNFKQQGQHLLPSSKEATDTIELTKSTKNV